MKYMTALLLGLFLLVALSSTFDALAQQSFPEVSITTTYKDEVDTTADWNFTDGELRLFPFVPTLIGGIDQSSDSLGLALGGDLNFVADYGFDLQVIDISDPANPKDLNVFPRRPLK